METNVGYLFGVLYFKCMSLYSLDRLIEAILMSTHSIHLQDKRRKSP